MENDTLTARRADDFVVSHKSSTSIIGTTSERLMNAYTVRREASASS